MVSKNSNVVWFDITNAPHVLFFSPIIKELKSKGYNVVITARDYSQTIPLLKDFGFEYKEIGGYGGKSRLGKYWSAIWRVLGLWKYLYQNKPNLAVSHGSQYSVVVSKLLGIKNIFIYDNEFGEIKKIAKKIDFFLKPEFLNSDKLENLGVAKEKIFSYPGLKEEIYLFDFIPKDEYKKLNVEKNKYIIVRPEAYTAHYYHNKKDLVFEFTKKLISLNLGYKIFVMPRNEEQKQKYESLDVILPKLKSVDLPSLICNSCLVVSGGGTVNREAAVLGKPVISLYPGEKLDVDKYLEDKGNVVFLKETDFDTLNAKKIIDLLQSKKKYFCNNEGKKYVSEFIQNLADG